MPEREADLFAAETLRPTNLLRQVFADCFGGPIAGIDADEDLCFRMGAAIGCRISPQEFARLPVLARAKMISGISEFDTNIFHSLEQRFHVSRTAMAIQLRDLKLVM